MKMSKEKTAFSRIMSNTGIIVFGRIVNAVCSFIYIPWTVKAIGLNDFGQLLLVISYIMLVSDITHLHSWQPLVHFGTASLREKKQNEFHQILAFCMRSDLLSGVLGMLVGVLGIAVFGHVMRWPEATCHIAELCSGIILFMNRGWPVGVMRVLNKFKVSTTIELVGSITRTVGTFIGYELGFGFFFFIFVWCLTQLVLFILYNGFAFWLVKKNIQIPFRWKEFFLPELKISGIWKLTLGTSVSEILEAFYKQISILLIGAWIGPEDAAVFRVSTQITNALATPANLLIPAMYPEFIRFKHEEDWKGFRYTIMRLLKVITSLGILIIFISMVFGGDILNYMLKYRSAYGGLIISILSFSAIINIATVPLEPILTVMGKVYFVLRYKIATIVMYIPSLFVFTYFWGVWGAAWSAVLGSFLMFALSSTRVYRIFSSIFQQGRVRS